jgi:hypothetical protein
VGDLFVLPESEDVSFVTGMVQDAMGALYDVDVAVWNWASGLFSDLWDALGAVWNWIDNILQTLWQWIQDAIHWLFHTLLPTLIRWINDIRAALTKFLHPLIQWLQWEKAWLNQVWNNVLKPIMNFIQALRQFLVVFRLMGLKWAAYLDQYLAGLEARIASAFIQAQQEINMIQNWLNFIIGTNGLFNLPLMLLSQLQTLPQLWAALANIPSAAIGAVDAQAQQTMAQSGTFSNAKSTLNSGAGGATSDDLTNYARVSALYQGDGYNIA